jgi:hypothetical protein
MGIYSLARVFYLHDSLVFNVCLFIRTNPRSDTFLGGGNFVNKFCVCGSVV